MPLKIIYSQNLKNKSRDLELVSYNAIFFSLLNSGQLSSSKQNKTKQNTWSFYLDSTFSNLF